MWKLWSGKSRDFLFSKWWNALNWELSWLIFSGGLKARLPLSLDSLQLLFSTVYWPHPCQHLPSTHPHTYTPIRRLHGCQNGVLTCCASCVDLCWILCCFLPFTFKPWIPVFKSSFQPNSFFWQRTSEL